MAKKKHTYNLGDIVKFKFLTGEKLVGKITELTYKEDNTASYKIRVEENSKMRVGFTIYPCMTDSRIIEVVQTALSAMRNSNKKQKAQEDKEISAAMRSGNKDELNQAIDAQRNFINGDI